MLDYPADARLSDPRLDDEEDEEEEGDETEAPSTKDGKDNDLSSKFLKTRTIIASKGVDDKLASSIINQALLLEQDDPDKLITVFVNSPGGSADSGFAIYDILRFVTCPVRTIATGICASAGVMIYLAGDQDQRFCTPTARFLLHQPSMRTMGQASDLEIISREIDRLKLQYNQIVADATGRKVADIERDVKRDFWLPANEAVKYGLVNKVIERRREIE